MSPQPRGQNTYQFEVETVLGCEAHGQTKEPRGGDAEVPGNTSANDIEAEKGRGSEMIKAVIWFSNHFDETCDERIVINRTLSKTDLRAKSFNEYSSF